SEGPASCPDSSKIGTIAIISPALSGPLKGSIFIGQPRPGEQYRLFMIASGFGINTKLEGIFKPDPSTGQVTVFFEDLPQVPFEDFQIHLFSGERALMATPTVCAISSVDGQFFPWNSSLPDQSSSDFFGLIAGPHSSLCPGAVRPFHPRLAA